MLALVTKEKITAIANALRQKIGAQTGYKLDDIPEAILGIDTGAGYKYEKLAAVGSNSNFMTFQTKGRAVKFIITIEADAGYGSATSNYVPVVIDSESDKFVGLRTSGLAASIQMLDYTKTINDDSVTIMLPSGSNIFTSSVTYDFFYLYE